MKMDSALTTGYLHGFSKEEQGRLFAQARMWASILYPKIDFSQQKNLLEIGCGVGAQTQILLENFPKLKISCVDVSPEQVEQAKKSLKDPIAEGRVRVTQANALDLPYPNQSFDGAFLCWFLEHVSDPGAVLRETARALKPGAVVYCNEGSNPSFYCHPKGTHLERYWHEFTQEQKTLGGDPEIGPKIGNLLLGAGFKNVELTFIHHHCDDRNPDQRRLFANFWKDLMLSAAPSLLAGGKVDEAMIEGMRSELDLVGNSEESVFFVGCVLARAVKV